jgi:hypothetical protein
MSGLLRYRSRLFESINPWISGIISLKSRQLGPFETIFRDLWECPEGHWAQQPPGSGKTRKTPDFGAPLGAFEDLLVLENQEIDGLHGYAIGFHENFDFDLRFA